MKTITGPGKRLCKAVILPLLVVAFLISPRAQAQMPDCISGTVMYGVFSPLNATPGNDSTEIRSIDFSTGAIGPLMGGKRYYIAKTLGVLSKKFSGVKFYGSSAMALSPVTNQFYLFTQMGVSDSTSKTSPSGPKDIIAINTLLPTPTMTVIGTTPISEGDYHIVKAAISPNGWGYAIGVDRGVNASNVYNPLYRFKVCTTPGCANGAGNFDLLGYLPDTGMMKTMNLFNGDIAFDNSGNLYFLSAAYASGKYTDSRLFKIKSTDIPSSAGTGIIPMSFIADYDALDSTGCSGIAIDPAGKMYFSLRRYQNNDPGTGIYTTELYKSTDTSTASIMSGFSPIPANTSVGDLASGYFANALLARNEMQLKLRSIGGRAALYWQSNNNTAVSYFEVQRSRDGTQFETIARQNAKGSSSQAGYSYVDEDNKMQGRVFYRIRQMMRSGSLRYYSNVVEFNAGSQVTIISHWSPNPVSNRMDCNVTMLRSGLITVRLRDQSGMLLRQYFYQAQMGENRIIVDGLSGLPASIYIAELAFDSEMHREKIVKQ